MPNRIEYEILENEEKVTLRVAVKPRFVRKEQATVFKTEDAKKVLLDNGVECDIMITSPNRDLSNEHKGSLQSGEWTFKRKKVKVEKTRTRTGRSTKSTKKETTQSTKD